MRGKLPAGSGPSPARPDRFKKGSFLRLDPEGWQELSPLLSGEQRATYWGLLALATDGVFSERSAGKLANLLDVKPTRARELIEELAQQQFAGGPLCFVEEHGGKLTVRLAINNGVLVLNSPSTPAPAKPEPLDKTAPRVETVAERIARRKSVLEKLAGAGTLELADDVLSAMAEAEPDGQVPGPRQLHFYNTLIKLFAVGGSHLGGALHDLLRKGVTQDDPVAYLGGIVERRVAESGRTNGESTHKPQPLETTPPVVTPVRETVAETVEQSPSDAGGERRTADGRLIAEDFDPEEMF